ncbi:hypothetical protein LDL05_25600 [Nonomuraea cavernae]|nr:hypothetical protein [Nonomuraea cavernae]
MEWPQEDEDHLRACGAALRTCATSLTNEVNPAADGAIKHAATNNSGDHIDELNAYWADYQDEGDQAGHLKSLAASLHALADGHDLFARIVEILKGVLLVLATYVLFALVWAASAAVVSGGLAAIKARGTITVLRAFARKAVATLRRRLEQAFGRKLIRAVETRLRRILGAKAPTFVSVPNRSKLVRTSLLATSALLVAEAPAQHSPPPMGPRDGIPGGEGYRFGSGQPQVFGYDHHFPYDPDVKPTPGDYLSWYAWRARLRGAQLIRPDLKDGLAAYEHYAAGSGTDFEIDYERAYTEDRGIREKVDQGIQTAKDEAVRLYRESGRTDFQMTGGVLHTAAETENWDKTLGGHVQWGNADVKVSGNQATMTITIHAEERYNFNKGETDAATGAADDDNGRFETLGWARSYRSHGALTRTVTWTIP